MKKYVKYIFRLLLFGLVAYLAARHIDFQSLRGAFVHVSLAWVGLAYICYLIRFIILGIRWHIAAIAHGQQTDMLHLIRVQISIVFLGIVFPMPDSEDGVKVVHMLRRGIRIATGMVIILYDRMAGVSILLLLLPLTFMLFAKGVMPLYMQSKVIQAAFIVIALPLVIFHRWIASGLVFFLGKYIPALQKRVALLRSELQKKIPWYFVCTSACLAFLHAFFGVAAAWILVYALQGHASFIYLFAGIPLYYISAMLPLSIQGLGLYETALVFVLRYIGVNPETAVTVGLIHLGFHLLTIAAGGFLYFFDRGNEINILSAQLKKLGSFLN